MAAYRHQPGSRQEKKRGRSMGAQSTGTHDVTYDLISILYHALQGAENYGRYLQDAEQSGDDEFTSFFLEMQEEEKRRAERAKELLMKRLEREGASEEEMSFEDRGSQKERQGQQRQRQRKQPSEEMTE